MTQVLMFTRIGDDELNIGKCTHAQARILQKRGHGKIVDGKLEVHIRPIHLQLASQRLRGPKDDENVSQAELDRRLAWLASLMEPVARIEAKLGESNIEHIQGAAKTAVASTVIAHRSFLGKGDRVLLDHSRLSDEEVDALLEGMSDEEVDALLNGGEEPTTDLPPDLWDSPSPELVARAFDYRWENLQEAEERIRKTAWFSGTQDMTKADEVDRKIAEHLATLREEDAVRVVSTLKTDLLKPKGFA